MAKKTVLLIGGGGVGTIAALNLDIGGLAEVTIVLRSNFNAVNEKGFQIESCDHGVIKNWKPSHVRNTVPDIAAEGLAPYDYIILSTKNCPDVPPTIASLVSPALPSSNTHTTLVLIQNGLNIEKPFLASHPSTPILSGVSLIGSAEPQHGVIVQDDHDRLLIGPFRNPNLSQELEKQKAEEFVHIYGAGKKTEVVYSPNVDYDRWRKLVYNACLNPICAITGLDTGRLRLADGVTDGLVRPAMKEIVAAAKVKGIELDGRESDTDKSVVEHMIHIDPVEIYLQPSMLMDVEKGNYIEFENLLGEPLREGKEAGVEMPMLEALYQLARAIQWRTREKRGAVSVPPKRKAPE